MCFCLASLLSAKLPPARDWCAGVIYGSDCRGLLKPIQFQDLASHFLSFMAHLMNSRYRLTCFIIVKTLIEVVFLEKKKTQQLWRGEKKSSFTTFCVCVCARNCFAWGSQPHHSATQWLADLANPSPHSPVIVLFPHLWCLVFCWFGPFLIQMVKAVVHSTLGKVSKLFLQASFKAHLSGACIDSISSFRYLKPGVGLFCFCFHSTSQHSLAGVSLQLSKSLTAFKT